MKPIDSLFNEEVKVINLGIPAFRDDLDEQGVEVVHVDWSPPAGGNKKMQSLLNQLKG